MRKEKPEIIAKLPSGLERQQIFHWLKKSSSLTAWRNLLASYRVWADATGASLRKAEAMGWGAKTSIPRSECTRILKGLAHLQAAIARLEAGDKAVFECRRHDDLGEARHVLVISAQSLNRVLEGENCIDQEHTPYWAEYSETLRATTHAWYECAILIVPSEHRERGALAMYGKWLQTQLAMQLYPERLERVPDPDDGTFVRTFGIVPCFGIWEPIKVPKRSLLQWIFGAPTPQPPFSITGAMNYLHGGSVAPEIGVETDTDNINLCTMWRLLWRDDRYVDGTIPEEEADYRFTKLGQFTSPRFISADATPSPTK